ncbi:MAG: glutamine-binding periplasmic protein of glutamine transporter [Chthonomonadales bacterium]|nr:glutamine-binding periplasmic protein of glutamine transporter [Chthonomonadales bacterium]
MPNVHLRMRPNFFLWIGILFTFLLASSSVRAQSSLDGIKQRGELIIVTDATYPPFEYMEGINPVGFDIDLGDAIGKELGVKVRWIPMAWGGVKGALAAHKCDMIISGVTVTEERKTSSAFSRPYFPSGQTIARRKGDTTVQKLQDLKDLRVSVQEDTTGQTALERLGVPKAHINRFDRLQDGLTDVINGKSAAAVADMPALKEILRKGYPQLELTGGVFTNEYVGVWMRKGEPELLDAVNRALGVILVDGRYAAFYKKWMPDPLTTGVIADLDKNRGVGTATTEQVDRVLQSDALPPPPTSSVKTFDNTPRFTIDFGLLKEVFPDFLRGAKLTLALTALALLIGIPFGLAIALARISPVVPLAWTAKIYVEAMRGTPLLVQIYVIYFVLPTLHLNFDPFTSGVIALSLNAGAYISEIFRAGIQSIETGQMEAARSLGMTYGMAMRWIILPQTIRRVLPPLTNEAVALLKDSSLVSVVSLSELMRVGYELTTSKDQPTTIYLGVALLYLCMTLPLTWIVRRLEEKYQPISRPRRPKGASTNA